MHGRSCPALCAICLRSLAKSSIWICRAPIRNWIGRCSNWSGIRSPTSCAIAPTTASNVRLNGSRPASRKTARSGLTPIINVARIREKALELGLTTEAELAAKSEAEICNFIFSPGFSTAAEVTSISGRGVGMDVVRNNIEQIGGTVDLKSVPGDGTTFTIKIPLTLAIVSALIVEAGGERFAVPQLSVLELVRASGAGEHRIERIKETPVLRLRNALLPLLYLKEVLRLGHADSEEGFVVVSQVGSQVFGLVVDGVFHTEEIVIKPMSSKLRHISVFSGT